MQKQNNEKVPTPYEEACMLYQGARDFTNEELVLYKKMLAQNSISLNVNIFEIYKTTNQ